MAVETAGISSDGFLQGGSISIRSNSENSISAGGNLDTYSTNGTASDITLSSPGRITLAGDITSYGSTQSGNISVTSESNTVTTNSIKTQSGTGPSGNITINGNNIAAGNLDSIGSTGAGNIQVRAGGSVTTLNIQSRTDEGNSGNIDVIALASINVLNSSTMAGNHTQIIAQLEQSRDKEFSDYFGQNLSNQLTSPESIRDALSTIASQTGNRSAIIYVTPFTDQLELVVFTPEGRPIRRAVPEAKREELLKVISEFRDKITAPRYRDYTSYLPPAQQLYKWLIAPIESELQAAKIDTLLFSMDAGLRGVPVAALHDGKQFLVEKYSLALIPSVSLIDTRYQPVQGKQVLAMGVSEFPDKEPLLAVPVELSEITQKLWQGKAFLNQDFTRDNLIAQRYNYAYPIIHLATHGEFKPGDISNSYIALWNDKLHLDELRNLHLNSPPVELLVISACRTAVGDEKAELGFAGFAVAAGVKTAVASLWYVSDAGTLGLMTEFYRHLADAKIKAEALRQTQLAMIRGDVRIEGGELRQTGITTGVSLPAELLKEGTHNLKHPYYWSGFTMIGSPW